MTTAAELPSSEPFEIHEAMRRVTEAVREMPMPSMFQLAADGFDSPFEKLVACIISIRTLEEASLPVARRLFSVARSPAQVAALDVAEIERLITPSTFADRKAAQVQAIAERVVEDYGGKLPCDGEVMQSFSGVGPKCAQLTLGIACGQLTIPVDIHVHRLTNRWGYIATKTPEQLLVALDAVLPIDFRPSINRLVLPFRKYICTDPVPRCFSCPLIDMCPKVGVSKVRK